MGIEERFNQAIEEWRGHCHRMRFSSRPGDFIECESYIKLVELGEEVLPLIRRLYDRGSDKPGFESLRSHLSILVGEIVKDNFQIPEKISGEMSAIEQYTISWLDTYLRNKKCKR